MSKQYWKKTARNIIEARVMDIAGEVSVIVVIEKRNNAFYISWMSRARDWIKRPLTRHDRQLDAVIVCANRFGLSLW